MNWCRFDPAGDHYFLFNYFIYNFEFIISNFLRSVVASGNVNHEEIVSAVERHFSSLPKSSGVTTPNSERPIYTPSLLFMRDDEMINLNWAVFYDASGVKHPDYYGFELLKRIFWNIQIRKKFRAH